MNVLNWCTGFQKMFEFQKLVYWSKYFQIIQVIVVGENDQKELPPELVGTELQSFQNRWMLHTILMKQYFLQVYSRECCH